MSKKQKMAEPQGHDCLALIPPEINWEDVNGLHFMKFELEHYITWPVKYCKFRKVCGKVDFATGFVLHGPLGCGKTLVAKAVAIEAGASFMFIKVPDFLNIHGGNSAHELHGLFGTAKIHAPCVFVLDEVDVLQRGSYTEPLLKQLIYEIDCNYDHWRGVFVMGATNRLDMVDRDLIRPDRFAKLVYVPLPTPVERVMILRALASNHPVDPSVDLTIIGGRAGENLNPNDIKQLLSEAYLAAVEEHLSSSNPTRNPLTIKINHFQAALRIVRPSVSGTKKLSCLPSTVRGSDDRKGKGIMIE